MDQDQVILVKEKSIEAFLKQILRADHQSNGSGGFEQGSPQLSSFVGQKELLLMKAPIGKFKMEKTTPRGMGGGVVLKETFTYETSEYDSVSDIAKLIDYTVEIVEVDQRYDDVYKKPETSIRADADMTEMIKMTPAELQSGHNRQKWAEGLIMQLEKKHEGRNSWLLNYGVGNEALALREENDVKFVDEFQAAETKSE